MKRIFVTILALVYFVAGSGMLLREHYCMGDLVETQIDFGQMIVTDTCGDCGDEDTDNSCCESKIKLVKKVEDQKISEYQVLDLSVLVTDLIPVFLIPEPTDRVFKESLPVLALQKPPPKSLPVFLENRNLRI